MRLIVCGCLAIFTIAAQAADLQLRLRDAAGDAASDTVVYLVGRQALSADRRFTIRQKDKRFIPAIAVVQAGTTVEFPNEDQVSHHVYSFNRPNAFELPLYRDDLVPAVRFDEPGIVVIGCNIHDSMLGYIVVVPTPHFGITDAGGELRLTGLPAGRYRLHAWSPRLDPLNAVALGPVDIGGRDLSLQLALDRRLRSAPAPGGDDALAWDEY
ncbi:MAG: methylamine utilization protein [Gammaproteobacteria bacterium]|nr:MAG: methylamine utilization protein [Gammaproteobacteria bacterium]